MSTSTETILPGKIRHAGKILRRAREARRISQSELARMMGRPPSFIAKGEQSESMTTWRFQDVLAILGYEIRITSVADRTPLATEPKTLAEVFADKDSDEEWAT